MKKFLPLFFAVLVCSCGGQKNNQQARDSSTPEDVTQLLDSEEDIIKRINEIYKEDDPQIFSASFRELIAKVNKYDEENIPDGEIGYFDYDILTQAQDDVTIESVSVSDITATTCIAHVDTGWSHLTVKLVKENGTWMVDNVNDERESMTEYLSNDK